MESSGAGRTGPSASRVLRSPAWQLGAAILVLGALVAVDLSGGRTIRIGGLLVAVPALSAVFLWPLGVLVVSVLTLGCILLTSAQNHTINDTNFPVVMATAVLVGVGAVTASVLRQRRERQLAQVRKVAAVTQRALLRPLPSRLGRVTISSMYLAADEEAAIGGDLYAAAVTEREATRVLVGDVQGKGLAAVEVAGLLLAAFRRAVRARTPLSGLSAFLDRSLREDLVDIAADGDPDSARDTDPEQDAAGPAGSTNPEARFLERFVTAVVVDIAADGGSVAIANSGHPPPLLIHGGAVEQLMPERPDLPLGLGDLSGQPQHIDTHVLAVGDILLLYTDGVIEARDRDGRFYPLADRLAHWTAGTPQALLEKVKADLLRYVDTKLADDVAMVAVQRVD